ncbi:MAG: type III pantothenate kinase [Saprospiraceae bacterium]
MNLIIDIGNTRTKIAIFKKGKIFKNMKIKSLSIKILVDLKLEHNINAVIISTVKKTVDTQIVNEIKRWQTFFIQLSHKTSLPIINEYQTPETLGRDRLAAVVGANQIYSNENCLVIDAGTCITYDFITMDNRYLGGSISPGLIMRYRAMHEFTAALPLLNKQRLNTFVGYNTVTSMQTGVEVGLTFEIQGFINKYIHKFGQIKVIMTGGDAEYLASQMKNKIFVIPDLVLVGLYKILTYNANILE